MKKSQPRILLSALTLGLAAVTTNASATCAAEPLIGSVCATAANFCPRGYMNANGAILSISQYSTLYSLLGITYGGDGRTYFTLPDLRSRTIVGAGQGPGLLNYTQGASGGLETVTLTTAQLPAHSHEATTDISGVTATLKAVTAGGETEVPTGNLLANSRRNASYSTATADTSLASSAVIVGGDAVTTISDAGASQPHTNVSPYLPLLYCIAVDGIYPSRP